jgi:hypothetical protein
MIGTAVAQNQSAQQGASNPSGVMGYGFTSPGTMGMMGPGMMGYDGSGRGMMRWGTSGGAMCSAMAGHIEGRLAYVKAELKITEAEESLWNAYAAAARDSTNSMLARCMTMMSRRSGSTPSLPDRLDQNEQLMAAQLDAMHATNEALKPLYTALSESHRFWGKTGSALRASQTSKMTRNGHYEHATICGNDIGRPRKECCNRASKKNGTLAHSATSSSARKQTEVMNAYDNPDSGTR